MGSDGLALLAWESTENRWSKIQVLQDERVEHSWELTELLVKEARWITPGESLLVFAVADGMPVRRVYTIQSTGELDLTWSTRPLQERYETVAFSAAGEHWIGTSFTSDHAQIALGPIGSTEPISTWRLDAGRYGAPDPFNLAEASYTVSWEAAVYEVDDDATELTYLGSLDLPPGSRVLDAGDSLLIEVADSSEEFRVLPIKRRVAGLRQVARSP